MLANEERHDLWEARTNDHHERLARLEAAVFPGEPGRGPYTSIPDAVPADVQDLDRFRGLSGEKAVQAAHDIADAYGRAFDSGGIGSAALREAMGHVHALLSHFKHMTHTERV